MKRYCRFLKLKADEALINEYILEHQRVWPEIKEGIRAVGILNMEIYLHEYYACMVMETVDEFDFERDGARLAALPRQAEWEAYMSRFQQSDEHATSHEKWVLMEQIFQLT